jgi:hypothetical protein
MENNNEQFEENAQKCLTEINETLNKYNLRLRPTFQFVPVVEGEVEDEVVTSEEDEEDRAVAEETEE